MARRATTDVLGRHEFNVSDARAPLLAHLARLNRRAAGTRSEAAIERAVDEWTRAILALPDAATLVKRHRTRGGGKPVSRAADERTSASEGGERGKADA